MIENRQNQSIGALILPSVPQYADFSSSSSSAARCEGSSGADTVLAASRVLLHGAIDRGPHRFLTPRMVLQFCMATDKALSNTCKG